MCFRCSEELSHQDGYFEYPQHIFWLRNKIIYIHTPIWRPVLQYVFDVQMFGVLSTIYMRVIIGHVLSVFDLSFICRRVVLF